MGASQEMVRAPALGNLTICHDVCLDMAPTTTICNWKAAHGTGNCTNKWTRIVITRRRFHVAADILKTTTSFQCNTLAPTDANGPTYAEWRSKLGVVTCYVAW